MCPPAPCEWLELLPLVPWDLLFAEVELEDLADSDSDDEELDELFDLDSEELDVLDVSSFCDWLFELEPDP